MTPNPSPLFPGLPIDFQTAKGIPYEQIRKTLPSRTDAECEAALAFFVHAGVSDSMFVKVAMMAEAERSALAILLKFDARATDTDAVAHDPKYADEGTLEERLLLAQYIKEINALMVERFVRLANATCPPKKYGNN